MALEIKYIDSNKVALECAKHLSSSIGNIPTLLLMSGGSSLELLPLLDPNANFSGLTVGLVDERFDLRHSNFLAIKNRYRDVYTSLTASGVQFIDTSPHKADQYEMADWYHDILEEKIRRIRQAKAKFIVQLGMGTDAHIAGILPYPEEEKSQFEKLFLNTNRQVVGFDATGKNEHTKRFTVTFPLLYCADEIIMYVTGQSKQGALANALNKDSQLHSVPASFIQSTNVKVTLYTDITI